MARPPIASSTSNADSGQLAAIAGCVPSSCEASDAMPCCSRDSAQSGTCILGEMTEQATFSVENVAAPSKFARSSKGNERRSSMQDSRSVVPSSSSSCVALHNWWFLSEYFGFAKACTDRRSVSVHERCGNGSKCALPALQSKLVHPLWNFDSTSRFESRSLRAKACSQFRSSCRDENPSHGLNPWLECSCSACNLEAYASHQRFHASRSALCSCSLYLDSAARRVARSSGLVH